MTLCLHNWIMWDPHMTAEGSAEQSSFHSSRKSHSFSFLSFDLHVMQRLCTLVPLLSVPKCQNGKEGKAAIAKEESHVRDVSTTTRETLFQCLCGQDSGLCTFCLDKVSPVSSTNYNNSPSMGDPR